MTLNAVLTRIEVADLAAALPVYQTLAGTDEVRRLQFDDFAMAVVGPFMLLEGASDVLARYRHPFRYALSHRRWPHRHRQHGCEQLRPR